MGPHGPGADLEDGRDGLVGIPLRDHAGDLAFARAQPHRRSDARDRTSDQQTADPLDVGVEDYAVVALRREVGVVSLDLVNELAKHPHDLRGHRLRPTRRMSGWVVRALAGRSVDIVSGYEQIRRLRCAPQPVPPSTDANT